MTSKLPIIVLSSPRTGSTIFAKNLSNEFNAKFFNEPSQQSNKQLHNFIRYSELSDQYVLKEHALNFIKFYGKDFISEKHTVIKIIRKNFVEQVLSIYVANIRKKFYYDSKDFTPDTMPLDINVLVEQKEGIKRYNESLDSFFAHKTVVYEDCSFEEKDIFPTVKPLNYDELYEWIRRNV